MRCRGERPKAVAAVFGMLLPLLLCFLPSPTLWASPAINRATPSHQAETPEMCGVNPSITIIPSSPVPDEPVQVRCSGTRWDACTPAYQSHEVLGNVITVDTKFDYPPSYQCAQVLMQWNVEVDIAGLQRGQYAVQLYITNRWGAGRTLCATRSFQVSDVLITVVYYDTYLTNEPDEAFRLGNISGSAVDLTVGYDGGHWYRPSYRKPMCQ